LIVSSQGQVLHVEGQFFWKFGFKHIVLVFSFTCWHLVNQKGSVESEHNKGTTVGYDDGWITGDCDGDMYDGLEVGIFAGVSVNSKDDTKDGCEVVYSKVGCGDSKTVQLVHVFLQCFFTWLKSQNNILFVFFLTHSQSLFLFENFNFGMLPDSSSHPGCVKDELEGWRDGKWLTDGCDEGMYDSLEVGMFVGTSDDSKVGTMDGCNDGESVQILHINLQWFSTSFKLQKASWFVFFLTQSQLLFLFWNFNFGMLPDSSLHSCCVEDIGVLFGSKVGTRLGCEVGGK